MARRNQEERRMQVRFFQSWNAFNPKNACAFSIPNEGARSKVEGAQMKAAGLTAGAPDIGVVIEGRFIGVEFKTQKGRVSVAQQAFGAMLKSSGAEYHVVRSEVDALKLLYTLGADIPDMS
jgi:hypothetical protein